LFFLIGTPDKPKTGNTNNNNKNGNTNSNNVSINRLDFEPNNFGQKINSGSGTGNTKAPDSKENSNAAGSEVKGGVEQTPKLDTKSGQGLNIDKLAKAVARHETADCTIGSAKYNNCFGIMQWDKAGNRSFKRYATKEDSYADFKRIWMNPKGWYQGKFPTPFLANKYSGNDRADAWLRNVTKFYYE